MSREEMIERLRVWAARAQHEVQQADTLADILNWQGQAQVLSSVATFLAESGAELSDSVLWKHVVMDREKALASWQKAQEGPEAMLHAGEVAGYDVALTALRDSGGLTWSERVLHYG